MKLSEFQNLDFQNVGGWTSGVKTVFAVLLLLVLIVAGWFLMLSDKQAELEKEQKSEAELILTYTEKQRKVANLPRLKQQLEEMNEMLQQMLRQLPSKTQMQDLLTDVSQTALSSGIDVQKFEPAGETIKEFYAEKPISLRMVGSYHQFGAFVSGVATLPRVVILTMHDISLKPQKGAANDKRGKPLDTGALVLEGTVKTYRYLDDNELEAAAEAAAAATGAAAPNRGRK